MLWLEMSRDPTHGGGAWGFGRSLWSPAYKRGTAEQWAFWDTLLKVRSGDQIVHLRGKGEGIDTIAFDRSPQVSAQGSHFLHLSLHQPAVSMTGAQINSHYQPCQASGFKDYNGIGPVPENTLFQDGQPLRRGLEAEAVTGLRSIIQTACSVLIPVEVDTYTTYHLFLLLSEIRVRWNFGRSL